MAHSWAGSRTLWGQLGNYRGDVQGEGGNPTQPLPRWSQPLTGSTAPWANWESQGLSSTQAARHGWHGKSGGKCTLWGSREKNDNVRLVTGVNAIDITRVSTWGWQSVSAVSSGSRSCLCPPGPCVYLLPSPWLFLKNAVGRMGLAEDRGWNSPWAAGKGDSRYETSKSYLTLESYQPETEETAANCRVGAYRNLPVHGQTQLREMDRNKIIWCVG